MRASLKRGQETSPPSFAPIVRPHRSLAHHINNKRSPIDNLSIGERLFMLFLFA